MSWREWWFQITNDMFWPIVAVWLMILIAPREKKETNDNGIIQPPGLPILVYSREETVYGGDNPEASRNDIDGDERVRDRAAIGLAEYPPITPTPESLPGSAAGN